jgi:hypothetical protein
VTTRRANQLALQFCRVKPVLQKYSAFQNTQITGISISVPPH